MSRLPRAAAVLAFLIPMTLAAASLSIPSALASAKVVVSAVPRLPHAVTPAIEADPPYVPQDSCDAVAKPGVIRFRNLAMATYAKYGAQDWGMAVSCAAEGMTSEHADGRAWDFALSSKNPTQYAAAQRFLTWLFATDAAGDEQANARRFGVMYVIYKDRIRSVGGDWEPYLPAQCGAKVKGRNVTVCHENHIHLSFTWNGAYARTSAWTGKVFPTDFGPCVAKGKKVAPKHTRVNLTPCAGTRTHGGGSGSGSGSGHPTHQWPLPVTVPVLPVTLPVATPITQDPAPADPTDDPVSDDPAPVTTDDPGSCTVLTIGEGGAPVCSGG